PESWSSRVIVFVQIDTEVGELGEQTSSRFVAFVDVADADAVFLQIAFGPFAFPHLRRNSQHVDAAQALRARRLRMGIDTLDRLDALLPLCETLVDHAGNLVVVL